MMYEYDDIPHTHKHISHTKIQTHASYIHAHCTHHIHSCITHTSHTSRITHQFYVSVGPIAKSALTTLVLFSVFECVCMHTLLASTIPYHRFSLIHHIRHALHTFLQCSHSTHHTSHITHHTHTHTHNHSHTHPTSYVCGSLSRSNIIRRVFSIVYDNNNNYNNNNNNNNNTHSTHTRTQTHAVCCALRECVMSVFESTFDEYLVRYDV